MAIEAFSFVIAVVAIACWAGPLAERLGTQAVETALALALPDDAGDAVGPRHRYLSRPEGISHIGRRPVWWSPGSHSSRCPR